jgi:hypothetical protein
MYILKVLFLNLFQLRYCKIIEEVHSNVQLSSIYFVPKHLLAILLAVASTFHKVHLPPKACVAVE